jgi:hypothetical protein
MEMEFIKKMERKLKEFLDMENMLKMKKVMKI